MWTVSWAGRETSRFISESSVIVWGSVNVVIDWRKHKTHWFGYVYLLSGSVVMHCKSWETTMNGRVKKINDEVATWCLAARGECSNRTPQSDQAFLLHSTESRSDMKSVLKTLERKPKTRRRWISCACWYFLVLPNIDERGKLKKTRQRRATSASSGKYRQWNEVHGTVNQLRVCPSSIKQSEGPTESRVS